MTNNDNSNDNSNFFAVVLLVFLFLACAGGMHRGSVYAHGGHGGRVGSHR